VTADDASGQPGSAKADKDRAVEEIRVALAGGETSEAKELPDELRHLPEKLKHLEIQIKREMSKQDINLKEMYAGEDIGLRRMYALGLFAVLVALLIVVNVIFWKYASTGRHWQIPANVLEAWLGATVVQVVGLVTVVTKYLFPNRDRAGVPEPPSPPTAT
jgi:hypothetical protein